MSTEKPADVSGGLETWRQILLRLEAEARDEGKGKEKRTDGDGARGTKR